MAVTFMLVVVPVLGQGSGPIQPPMGKYVCLTSRFQFSPIQGPAGPIMTITYDPSVLGTLELDGKSAYKMETSGKSAGIRSIRPTAVSLLQTVRWRVGLWYLSKAKTRSSCGWRRPRTNLQTRRDRGWASTAAR